VWTRECNGVASRIAFYTAPVVPTRSKRAALIVEELQVGVGYPLHGPEIITVPSSVNGRRKIVIGGIATPTKHRIMSFALGFAADAQIGNWHETERSWQRRNLGSYLKDKRVAGHLNTMPACDPGCVVFAQPRPEAEVRGRVYHCPGWVGHAVLVYLVTQFS